MRSCLRLVSTPSYTCKLEGSASHALIIEPSRISRGQLSSLTQPSSTKSCRTSRKLPFKTPYTRQQPFAALAAQTEKTSSRGQEEAKLVILTTLGCQYCRKTKTALSDAGFDFKDVDLSTNLDALKRVKETTGQRSVPQVSLCFLWIPDALQAADIQTTCVCFTLKSNCDLRLACTLWQVLYWLARLLQVFVDGKLLGGSSEILDLLKSGKLEEMLNSKPGPALPKELADIVETENEQSSQVCIFRIALYQPSQ